MEHSKFSQEVLFEAASIDIGKEILDERQPETGITIDDVKSKDLDDAFYLETKDEGWILNVSIADVAYAIKKDSNLFNDALQRVTTLYHKSGTDPMLPKILSEKKLSLFEDKLRPAITFSINLSYSLEIKNIIIRKTAFRSKKKMNYAVVDKILDGQISDEQYEHLVQCYNLAFMLMSKRRENGALAIYDLIKGVYTNEEGEILVLPEEQRHKSNIIVQEFMILTNTAVAQYLVKKNRTFIFRNHTARSTTPDHKALLEQYDLALSNSKYFETLRQKTELWFERAFYGIVLKGHFGLNLPAYAHFTSPIRRLPDLINQFIIHSLIDGRRNPFSKEKLKKYSLIINNKYSLLKKEKNLYFKEKNIKELSDEASGKKYDELLSLDTNSFKKLLKRTCKNDILTDDFNRVILTKLNDYQLSTEHFIYILFDLKKDSEEKRRLKEKVLSYISEHKEIASQVINTAVQQKYIDKTKIDTIILDTGFAVRILLIKKTESLSPPQYAIGNSKKDTQHSASYDFLNCYIYHSFVRPEEVNVPVVPSTEILNEETSITSNKESNEGTISENYSGKLNELCNAISEFSLPIYEFKQSNKDNKPYFNCLCKVKTSFKTEESSASGGSKKITKQLAAKSLLKILLNYKLDGTEAHMTDENKDDEHPEVVILENYIGLLEEISKKNKNLSHLNYTFNIIPRALNPAFTCKCTIYFREQKFETYSEASKKKNAKQIAAKEMYEHLNKINALEFTEERNVKQNPVKKEKEMNINYTGILTELCKRHKNWSSLHYEYKISGLSHSPEIICNCTLYINNERFESKSESYKKKIVKQLASLEMLKHLSIIIAKPHTVEEKNIKNIDSLYMMTLKNKCLEEGLPQPEIKIYSWQDADPKTCTCHCTINRPDGNLTAIGLGNNIVEAASDAEEQILKTFYVQSDVF